MTTERRRYPRMLQEGSTIMLFDYEGQGGPDRCYTYDISAGGIGIQAERAYAVSKQLGFKMDLPGGQTVAGVAAVRWGIVDGRRFPHGLEIIKMDHAQRRILDRYLRGGKMNFSDFAKLITDFAIPLVIVLVARDIFANHPEVYRYLSDHLLLAVVFTAAIAAFALMSFIK